MHIQSIVYQDMMGRDDLPSVYGIFNFLVGIGIVIVPIITGSLVDHFGTYKARFLFFAGTREWDLWMIHGNRKHFRGAPHRDLRLRQQRFPW